MPRCNQCNRLCSIEEGDLEVASEQVDDDGHVTFTVHMPNLCAECSTEVRGADLDVDKQVNVQHEHAKTLEDDTLPHLEVAIDIQRTSRQHPPRASRRKTYYGIEGTITVKCDCGWESEPVDFAEEIQASSMEDMQ